MLKLFAGVVASAALFVGSIFGIHPAPVAPVVTAPSFGNINPTGGGTYYLQSTISSSQTTVALSSFTEPVSNIPYTMSYLNSSIEYGTIAPQTTQSEFISFTGITQNSDGSATLTGVSRGLGRSYPYTASTTLSLPHAGQSRFILSNSPQLYNSYGALSNNNTWSGVNTFSSASQPAYDGNPAVWSSQLSFVDKAYVDAGVLNGAATSTFSNQGLVQLATNAQVAAGTASSTTGSPLAIPNKVASSTYNGSTAFNGEIPALRSTKDIDPNFIGTSTGNTYNFGAVVGLNGTTTVGGSGLMVTATSTFSATTTVLNAALISNRNLQQFTSATTTTSWPLPFVVATSTGRVSTASSALASSTIGFVGFSQGSVTSGSTAYIQTSGTVSGFTGLTVGADYYVQDNGTIGTTPGTLEMFVGTAVSATQIVLEAPRNLQYSGSVSVAASASAAAVPSYVRQVIISLTTQVSGGSDVDADLVLTQVGKTSATYQTYSVNSGGGAVATYGASCTWTANAITCTKAGNNTTIGGTIYFFR